MDFALIMKLLLCNGVFIVPRPFFLCKSRGSPGRCKGESRFVQRAPCTDGRHRLQKKVGARCDENRGLTDKRACAILGITKRKDKFCQPNVSCGRRTRASGLPERERNPPAGEREQTNWAKNRIL